MRTMVKQLFALGFTLWIPCIGTFGQIGINTDGSPPDPSAGLDVKFSNKGFLPPRMTTIQRNAIGSPAEGLVIYNTDERTLNIFNGTSWAPITPVVCGQPFTDTRDGKVYTTVLIGAQCWMAQNLNIGLRIDITGEQTNDSIIEKYCYDDAGSNCDVYGGLYQWGEMVQYFNGATNGTTWDSDPTGNVQGICPTGWHLPTDAEWSALTSFLGGDSIAGGKMKEAGTVHWLTPNTGATNLSGFTALPGGYFQHEGSTLPYFGGLTTGAEFWSSTQSYINIIPWLGWSTAVDWSVQYNSKFIYRSIYGRKVNGLSVRCIRD
jgi:uncharacterized protein (TIGR02145 family)